MRSVEVFRRVRGYLHQRVYSGGVNDRSWILVIGASLVAAFSGAGSAAAIISLEISPENPLSSETISATLRGEFPTSGWEIIDPITGSLLG